MVGTLIEVTDLVQRGDASDVAVVDCRFVLADPASGRDAYRAGHIPGAAYAHLGEDLSGAVAPGRTGRHPLPEPRALAATFGRLGIDGATLVVACDDAGGALAAARLWWLLRWLGHDRVAVLNGGWRAWLAAGLPVRAGDERRAARVFEPRVRPEMIVTAGQVDRARADPTWRVLDARSAERYRGENETIDPVAGRIPGARSAPYADNLNADGKFRGVDELRRQYGALLASVPAARVVCYCGSGVTAAHDVLALAHAGLGEARLYPGSWSEWITDASRPVATG